MASYSNFDLGLPIAATEAFEVPGTPAVQLHDILTRFLNGSGGIDSVVNGTARRSMRRSRARATWSASRKVTACPPGV